MTEKEKMLAGLPYDAGDPELMELAYTGKNLAREFNRLDYRDRDAQRRILEQLLGSVGENVQVTAPFYVDYGAFITLGNNVEINMNCVFLDCNAIAIGDGTLIAPGVHIYAVFHPLRAEDRMNANGAGEFPYALGLTAPVTIGRNCWIGGNASIMPGVTIGDNTTIGAGSLVASDIPANVLAFGVPCKVVRPL